jgi:hypothetical protein
MEIPPTEILARIFTVDVSPIVTKKRRANFYFSK